MKTTLRFVAAIIILTSASTSAAQLVQINFSQLPSPVVNGEMFYVNDGIPGTPCTGGSINGGVGAIATGINGVWVCTAADSPVIDVTAMGAKCDGHSDDTNPFFYAIAAAQNGGTVTTPANRVCYCPPWICLLWPASLCAGSAQMNTKR